MLSAGEFANRHGPRALPELSRFGWDSGLKPVPEAAEVSLNQ
jgi:hypothetical protein